MPWKKRMFFLVILILALTGILLQSEYIRAQAKPAHTSKLEANAWNYLPVVYGYSLGSIATPTLPSPTLTATPTNTATSEPVVTRTPEPGRLAVPTLFNIQNSDRDGNFTVGWSLVTDAEYYRLQQKRNNNNWKEIYVGPAQEVSRSGLSDGQYCYRVEALNTSADSEWSAPKCTSVVSPTNTPGPTKTPLPAELDTPTIEDIQNPDFDGNYLVQWSSVTDAERYRVKQNIDNTTWEPIYDGPDRSINRSNMPEGQYCYRVRAFSSVAHSDWSADKCTIVSSTMSTLTPTPTPILTSTPTPTLTSTPTSTPTPVYNGDIPNGDFEDGPTVWYEYSVHGRDVIVANYSLPIPPHSGLWAARLGGLDYEYSFVEQVLVVPHGSKRLTFYAWLESEDYCGYDYAFIDIATKTYYLDLCSNANTYSWEQFSFPIGEYAGQQILIRFRVETDYVYLSSFYLDDAAFVNTYSIEGAETIPLQVTSSDEVPSERPKAKPRTDPGVR